MRLRSRRLTSPDLPGPPHRIEYEGDDQQVGREPDEVQDDQESNQEDGDRIDTESEASNGAEEEEVAEEEENAEEEDADEEMAAENPGVVDRNAPVMMGDRQFPPPNRYDDASWWSDNALVAGAPWFDIEAIDHGDAVRHYVRAAGDLPGKIPLDAVTTWCWRNQFVPWNADLFTDDASAAALEVARAEFIRRAFEGVERISTLEPVDAAFSGMFLYRTFGEMDCLEAVRGINPERIAAWRGQDLILDEAWVRDKPQLKAEFRYTRKAGPHWTINCKNERRLRSKYGRPVPYQCLSTFGVRRSFFERAFCALTPYWSRIEVPRGCAAELPPIFSYKMRELMDPASGWWVVAYTEFAVKVAAFVLMDAYDRYRLWALSPTLITQLLRLNLDRALGNAGNVRERRRLLRVIQDTNFNVLPDWWSARGQVESRSPGRTGPGADWVWYDPWQRCRLNTGEEAERRRANAPYRIPFGHPRGWDFTAPAVGWTHEPVQHDGWVNEAGQEDVARGERENEDADAPVAELQQMAASTAAVMPIDVDAQGAGPSTAVAASGANAGAPAANSAGAAASSEGDRLRAVLELLPNVPDFIKNGSPEVVAAFLFARMSNNAGGGGSTG